MLVRSFLEAHRLTAPLPAAVSLWLMRPVRATAAPGRGGLASAPREAPASAVKP